MALESKLSFSENKNFFASLSVYAVGSAIDFASTYYGLVGGEIEEFSPLIESSIAQFGFGAGIVLPKLLIGGVIVGAATYLQKKKNRGETRFSPAAVCYFGGVITAGVGLSWILDNYLFF